MKAPLKALTAVAALVLLAPGSMLAQTAYNTGEAANVNGAFQDSKWQISMDAGSTFFQALQVQGQPGVWQASTAAHSWISKTSTGSGGTGGGGGTYDFRTFIDLTGYDQTTATLSFQCAYDNGFVGISLNGGGTGATCGFFGFGATQTVSSGWVSGLNELRVTTQGDNQTDGLIVGNMAIRATALPVTTTPEPASMMLLATGLVGMYVTVRRRKTT